MNNFTKMKNQPKNYKKRKILGYRMILFIHGIIINDSNLNSATKNTKIILILNWY